MADPDFFVKAMSFTKNAHRIAYPAINPTRSELSQAGKVVVTTGASRGLGRVCLAETERQAKEISPDTTVLKFALDVLNEPGMNAAFKEIIAKCGPPQVLINNAGSIVLETIAEADIGSFWGTIEVNLKGVLIATKAFLQANAPETGAVLDAGSSQAVSRTILNITSCATQSAAAEMDSYMISKLALLKSTEFLAAEHPAITSISLDPGMVATDMAAGIPLIAPFTLDDVSLAGGAAVWLTSGDKAFLSGRYLSANWDVEEIMNRKNDISERSLLVSTLKGVGSVEASELANHK
ncbi:hypothetical protein BJX64DRAFT_296439 [Aspergillus heterothallicus]